MINTILILLHFDMNRYPQQLFTAEQAAAGAFLFVVQDTLFWKGVFWSTQALLTAEQAAAGVCFCERRHAFFQKDMFGSETDNINKSFIDICQYTVLRTYLPTIRQQFLEPCLCNDAQQ